MSFGSFLVVFIYEKTGVFDILWTFIDGLGTYRSTSPHTQNSAIPESQYVVLNMVFIRAKCLQMGLKSFENI